MHRQAARNRNGLACDKSGIIGSQKTHDTRKVGWLRKTLHWNGLFQTFGNFLRPGARCHFGKQGRICRAGTHCVQLNAFSGKFAGNCLGK